MSATDGDLVAALRAELAAIDPSRACDRRAEAFGLGSPLATREAAVARLAVRLGRDEPASTQLVRSPGRRRTFHLAPGGASVARPGELPSVRQGAPQAGPAPFDWGTSADHCQAAYLRGLFLSRGSLSLVGGRTHLEFVVDAGEAPLLARRLADLGLPAGWRIRRGRGVVTWKSADTVGTFLRTIGAGAALLEIEARQVARTLRGDLNRVLNAESANLERTVAASARQLDSIAILREDGRLTDLPPTVRLVAAAREETPEASLGELAGRLGLNRSAVQRAFECLERAASAGASARQASRAARRGWPAPAGRPLA